MTATEREWSAGHLMPQDPLLWLAKMVRVPIRALPPLSGNHCSLSLNAGAVIVTVVP
jgi:hypothetical protein